MPAATLQYLVPNGNLTENIGQVGTRPAASLWASLAIQLNAIFADQDLPQLGYMNDLLYIASAIAPAAFNDITMGNNTSSFTMGGAYSTLNADGTWTVNVTPTGNGYYAGPGYDLVSGLGSPNGLLLARALTTIAHSQVSYSTSPDMLDADGSGWDQRRRPEPAVPDDVGTATPTSHSILGSDTLLLHQRRRPPTPGQPAGAAVDAGRLRSQPRAPVRQVRPGRGDAVLVSTGERRRRDHQRHLGRCHPGALSSRSASPTVDRQRRRPRRPAGRGGRDGERSGRPDGDRAGRARTDWTACRSASTASTICRARSTARRPAKPATRRRAGARLSSTGDVVNGPGYGNSALCRAAPMWIPAILIARSWSANQQQQHRLDALARSTRRVMVGRPSWINGAEHLGLGRHAQRRRSRSTT